MKLTNVLSVSGYSSLDLQADLFGPPLFALSLSTELEVHLQKAQKIKNIIEH